MEQKLIFERIKIRALWVGVKAELFSRKIITVLVVVSAVSCSALVLLWVNKNVGEGPPLLWFIPAVVISAYWGGLIPGVISLVLSTFLLLYLLPPIYSLDVTGDNDRLRLLIFISVGLFVSFLMERLHRSVYAAAKILKEKQEALNQLKIKENDLKHLLSTIPAAVISIDYQRKFRFCNETFANWLGKSSENLIGLRVENVVPPEYYAKIKPRYDQGFEGKRLSFDEFLEIGGKGRYVHVHMIPEVNKTGGVTGCTTLKYDITSHVNLEKSLLEAKREAEAANRSKSLFLANMSHEIRTPLAAILGFSGLVANTTPSETNRKEWSEAIARNGAHLNKVIGDILDFSKVEAGKFDIASERVEVKIILQNILETLSSRAKEKGIDLLIKNNGVVPVEIQTDATRLTQILLNVAGNAIKFTERGSVEIIVQQTFKDRRPQLTFLIKDTGIGLSKEQVGKLFAPFSQADESIAAKFGGTGLGLILSKKIAQKMNGDLKLECSELGKGSTFSVSVDIGDVASDWSFTNVSNTDRNDINSQFIAAKPLLGLDVLLVEDSEDLSVLMDCYLRNFGAKVVLASNGQEAMLKLETNDVDLILMDIQMPIMCGYETVERLRQNGYGKKIYALTAHVTKEETTRILASGFDDCLAKPIDFRLLVAKAASIPRVSS